MCQFTIKKIENAQEIKENDLALQNVNESKQAK